MKFTKTAVAVAIAGFAAMPMMAAAETTLSGVVQVKVEGTDVDGDDPNFAAGDVRLAIATEHELNSGLIGYGNLQLNLDNFTGQGGINQVINQVPDIDPVNDPSFDPDNPNSRDPVNVNSEATTSSDNVYVGVKGGFGDVRWGEIPLAVEYGQLANDIHDVGATTVDGLSYTGTFGPVGFGLNYSPAENSDMFGAGIKFALGGFNIGLGFEDRDERQNASVGASFALAGFSIGVQYWQKSVDDETGTPGEFSDTDGQSGIAFDDLSNIAVKAGYSIAGVSLGFTYSVLASDFNIEDVADDDVNFVGNADGQASQQVIRLDAGYDLGGGMDISGRVQNTSTDLDDAAGAEDPDDLVYYRVMLTKSF